MEMFRIRPMRLLENTVIRDSVTSVLVQRLVPGQSFFCICALTDGHGSDRMRGSPAITCLYHLMRRNQNRQSHYARLIRQLDLHVVTLDRPWCSGRTAGQCLSILDTPCIDCSFLVCRSSFGGMYRPPMNDTKTVGENQSRANPPESC